MLKNLQRNSRGFSLIEVMVALFVLSVGMLGVVKLETAAYSSTNVAAKRSIAAVQAASLAASMHINRGYWTQNDAAAASITVTGSVVAVPSGAPLLAAAVGATPNCAVVATPCSVTNMAAYDLQQWATSLASLLPNETAAIQCNAATPVACNININWSENTVASNQQETGTLAGPSYTLYVEP
jgi:type IV pilus assembly protein PilV